MQVDLDGQGDVETDFAAQAADVVVLPARKRLPAVDEDAAVLQDNTVEGEVNAAATSPMPTVASPASPDSDAASVAQPLVRNAPPQRGAAGTTEADPLYTGRGAR